MWLEIEDLQSESNKIWNLQPEIEKDYEIRVCVYDTKNIPKMDPLGTSDVYITSYINEKEK